MLEICTPITDDVIRKLNVRDMIYISGYIFCGRDAVLPKIVKEVEDKTLDENTNLKGNVIFHTDVSPAGVGPTSSNKLEIEAGMLPLSKHAGIKMHLGKGKIKDETVRALSELNSVYAVIPLIIAAAKGRSIYS